MNPFKRAWRFLTRPSTEEPDGALHEYMLKTILISLAAISVTGTLLSIPGLITGIVPADTLLILLSMDALFILGWYISGKGGWKYGRYIPVALFLLSAVYGNYVGGMGAPAMLLYVIAITVTVMLFSERAQYVIILVSLVLYLTLAYLHKQGIIVAARSDSSAFYNRVLIAGSAILCVGILLRFLLNQFEGALKLSREREAELAASNEELQAAIEELEATNEEFEAQNEELVRMNYEIEESENYNRMLFSDSNVPMVVLDPDTYRFTDCNNAAVKSYGYKSRDEVIGLTPVDVSAPVQYDGTDSAAGTERNMAAARAQGSHLFEWRHRRRDGMEWDAEVHLMTFNVRGKPMMQFTLKDITKRKRAEDALRESEGVLRSLLNATPAGVGMLVNRHFMQVNDTLCKITGYSKDELLGHNSRILYADDREYDRTGDEIYGEMRRTGLGTGEVRLRRKDGTEIDALIELAPIDANDPTMGECATMLDITDRKRAETALKEREGVLRSILDAAPVGVGLLLNRQFKQVNSSLCRMTGYTEEELLGRLTRILYPDDEEYEKVGRELYADMRHHKVGMMEVRLQRKNGEIFPVLLGLAPFDPQDFDAGICATVLDITDRKRAEEALRESEAVLRSIFNATPVGIAMVVDRRFKQVNASWCRITGYSEEMLLGRSLRTVYVDDDEFERVGRDLYDEMNRTGLGSIETRMRRKNGDVYDGLLHIAPVDPRNFSSGLCAILMDITDRKRAEEAIRETEERFRLMADSAPVMIGMSGLDGKVSYFNRTWIEFMGASSADESGRNWTRGIHPEDRDSMCSEIQKRVALREPYRVQYRMKRYDGEYRWVLNTAVPRYSADGQYFGYIGIALDITERIEFEERISYLNLGLEKKVNERTEELRMAYEDIVKTNRELETTLHSLHDTQHQLVQSEKLAALGQLAAGMAHELNTPLGAIISSNHSMIDMIRKVLPAVAETITRWDSADMKWFGDMMAINLSGATNVYRPPERKHRKEIRRFVEEAGIPESRTLADTIADLDVFEYVKKNPRLMEHEHFGEILDAVSFAASMRRLGEIVAIAADKATHVVGALRSYLRQDDPGEITSVDVKAELDMIMTLYHNKLKYGVTVVGNYDNAGFVLGSRNNLNQVWMNLINNALQAMEYKGNLEVSAEHRGEWTLISIADSGPGIPAEIRDRIFEPFFTTKRYGEGIGLGLDICLKIVETLGGRIEYDSVPGRTVFRVWLKAVEEQH